MHINEEVGIYDIVDFSTLSTSTLIKLSNSLKFKLLTLNAESNQMTSTPSPGEGEEYRRRRHLPNENGHSTSERLSVAVQSGGLLVCEVADQFQGQIILMP